MLGEVAWVEGHFKVGEHGGDAMRGGMGYGRVGGIDGGVGGKHGGDGVFCGIACIDVMGWFII